MKRALEIMRSSALTPLKTPVKSMGGLIGGEAKKLAQHAAKGRSICGDVLHKAAQYAMAGHAVCLAGLLQHLRRTAD